MILTTLIISCLTLIAISVGLFLNLKSNRNTLTTIANFEEAILGKVENVKSEILSKIIELNNNTHLKVDTTKTEIQTTVNDSSKFVYEQLITKTKESDVNNYNAIESAKKAVLESLEPRINELKTETNLYLQKHSTDINSKVDTALQAQEKQQTELLNEVKNKFSKIIEEIKSPLTLD